MNIIEAIETLKEYPIEEEVSSILITKDSIVIEFETGDEIKASHEKGKPTPPKPQKRIKSDLRNDWDNLFPRSIIHLYQYNNDNDYRGVAVFIRAMGPSFSNPIGRVLLKYEGENTEINLRDFSFKLKN